MFKDFKKSPENPFNQATVAFDATKEEKLEALKKLRAETENRYIDASFCLKPRPVAEPNVCFLFLLQTSRKEVSTNSKYHEAKREREEEKKEDWIRDEAAQKSRN